MADEFDLEWFYDDFPRIEGEFAAALDESLEPGSPDLLFEIVERQRRPDWTAAVDVGCGEGAATIRLARGVDLDVIGVDPVGRHLELARAAAVAGGPEISERVRFVTGVAEAIPCADEQTDLVFCRDVLSHVHDLARAYGEFERILRPRGVAIVYQMFGTERLEPSEAAWLWQTMGVVPTSADLARSLAVIGESELELTEHIAVGTEWGEWREEQYGTSSRRLLHAARLLRDPDRYVARFGRAAYDGMLGDCLWSVFGMIGKLSRHAFVLRKD